MIENLQFNISFFIVVLMALLAGALTYLLYRLTNPKISVLLKGALALSRFIALFLLILLLFKPNFAYRVLHEKTAEIALFIDNSASMAYSDEKEIRQQDKMEAFQFVKKLTESENIPLKTYLFNEEVIAWQEDTLKQAAGFTNFSQVIQFIERKAIAQAIVISDGVVTAGEGVNLLSPAMVHTIGVGFTGHSADMLISNVDYTPVIYNGKEQSYTISVRLSGAKEKQAKLSMYVNGNPVSSQDVNLIGDGVEQNITLRHTPQKTGMQNVNFTLSGAVNEGNRRNNNFSFQQKVLKSKIKLALVSHIPNYDHKFIKQALKSNQDIEVTSIFMHPKLANNSLDAHTYDAYILQNFPLKNSSEQSVQRAIRLLQKHGRAPILFLSAGMDTNRLLRLIEMPINSTIRPLNKMDTQTVLPLNDENGLLALFSQPDKNSTFWSMLPPVTRAFNLRWQKSDFTPLLKQQSKGNNTVLAIGKKRRQVLFNMSDFWKWHFFLQTNIEYKNGFQQLLMNTVRWNIMDRGLKNVELTTRETQFFPGKTVVFKGFVYNAQQNVSKNAHLQVEAVKNENTFLLDVEQDSSGRFLAYFTPSEEGSYILNAKGFINGQNIGNIQKSINVTAYNKEFVRVQQDTMFLKQLAQNNNGTYFTLQQIERLKNHLNRSPTKKYHKNNLELYRSNIVLYILLSLVVLEWAVRKKNNLA